MTALPASMVKTALHHPGVLRHRSIRLLTAGSWLVGAAVVWVDSATGPFSGLFPLGLTICLLSGLVLRWSYRRILAWFGEDAGDLDEREAFERARTFRTAYLILCLVLLLLLFPSMFVLSGYQDGGWRLKELAYLIPLAMLWAPGAAAALVLPTDPDDSSDQDTTDPVDSRDPSGLRL